MAGLFLGQLDKAFLTLQREGRSPTSWSRNDGLHQRFDSVRLCSGILFCIILIPCQDGFNILSMQHPHNLNSGICDSVKNEMVFETGDKSFFGF